MVRLLFILFIGAAAWYGWRAFRRHQERIAKALRESESTVARDKAVELEKDPDTGVYRPRDRDE